MVEWGMKVLPVLHYQQTFDTHRVLSGDELLNVWSSLLCRMSSLLFLRDSLVLCIHCRLQSSRPAHRFRNTATQMTCSRMIRLTNVDCACGPTSGQIGRKKKKNGRLPIAYYKQKPAGSDLWPVNRCIPNFVGMIIVSENITVSRYHGIRYYTIKTGFFWLTKHVYSNFIHQKQSSRFISLIIY